MRSIPVVKGIKVANGSKQDGRASPHHSLSPVIVSSDRRLLTLVMSTYTRSQNS